MHEHTMLNDPDPVTDVVAIPVTEPAPVRRKPRRNRKSARDAGAKFERRVAEWLANRLGDDRIERRVKNGTKDRGDVAGVKTIRGGRVVIEAKDHSGEVKYTPWLREAEIERGNDDAVIGCVVVKRAGITDIGEQLVLMNVETLARLIEGGPDDLRGTA
jgi:hypothetical protein